MRLRRLHDSDLRQRLRAWEAKKARVMAHYRQLMTDGERCPARKGSDPGCTCSEDSLVVAALDDGEPVEVDAHTILNAYRDDEAACPIQSSGSRWYLGWRMIPFDAVFIVEADGSMRLAS